MRYIWGQKLAMLSIVLVLPWATSAALAENAGEPAASDKPVSIAAAASGLAWQHDYKQALSLASSKDKLVLIDLYTDWCGWCKKLDRDTYTNADVQAFLKKQFVLLKLNAEDGGDGEAVAKKFQVRGYPCTIIMDAKGKLQGKPLYGYYSPQEYPEEVSKALKNG